VSQRTGGRARQQGTASLTESVRGNRHRPATARCATLAVMDGVLHPDGHSRDGRPRYRGMLGGYVVKVGFVCGEWNAWIIHPPPKVFTLGLRTGATVAEVAAKARQCVEGLPALA